MPYSTTGPLTWTRITPLNDNFRCSLIFSGTKSKALTNATTPTRTRLYAIAVNKGTTIDSLATVWMTPRGFVMGNGGVSVQMEH